MSYLICLFSPGKCYAGITAKPRTRDEAIAVLSYMEGLEACNPATLLDHTPSSVTTADGYRVTVDRLTAPE